MNLTELFTATNPCIVGFISRTTLETTQPPLFPHIFGTGFLVSREGIVVTNRHVVQVLDQVPNHPHTGGSQLGAIMWLPGAPEDGRDSWQMLVVDIHGSTMLSEFTSTDEWFGKATPDIGFVQLRVREVSCLELA